MWKGAWQSSVWKGHGDVLRLFVEGGVDVDEERDEKGRTLLYQACWKNNRDAVRALCENGADILAVDDRRYWAFGLTMAYFNIRLEQSYTYHRVLYYLFMALFGP